MNDSPRTPPAPTHPPLPTSLAGSHVLIIGGGTGWGAATAGLLAGVGAAVTVASRSGKRPEGLPDGADIGVRRVDFLDEDALRALVDGLPRIDHVLVTAATILGGPVAATPYEQVADTIVGWLKGSYQVAHVAGPRITPGGSLTFTSGISVVRPQPNTAAPAAAGGGIEALGRVLALELAPVRVNTIRPGATDTALFRRLAGGADDATVAAIGSTLPLGRIARPAEVAAAALFLMSNPYVTGTVLGVDGAASLA